MRLNVNATVSHQPQLQSGRNITCDNFFTSVQLADLLYHKKLILLGTVRKCNRDIPDQFIASRSKDVGSSLFAFTATTTLVSYRMLDIAAINSIIVFLHNNPDFHPKDNCKRLSVGCFWRTWP